MALETGAAISATLTDPFLDCDHLDGIVRATKRFTCARNLRIVIDETKCPAYKSIIKTSRVELA